MTLTKAKPELIPFYPTCYLGDDAAIAEYMIAVLEEGENNHLLLALGDVPRAGGMAHNAKEAGLVGESYCKTLSAGAKPSFDTAGKVASGRSVLACQCGEQPHRAHLFDLVESRIDSH